MDNRTFIQHAKQEIITFYREQNKDEESLSITENDIYVVWFCKTLQNWKSLVSTNVPDGMYYEITYDGDKKCIYFDAYKKIKNKRIANV